MKYTLRQLEVFLATAHYENLTRAAASLSMSQSAASSALKDLESQFDVQLFDRVGKRLQLNALGDSIRPRAQALLEQASSLEEALARHQGTGHLRVGATLSIGNYLAVEIMARYMSEQEGARVELEVANTGDTGGNGRYLRCRFGRRPLCPGTGGASQGILRSENCSDPGRLLFGMSQRSKAQGQA